MASQASGGTDCGDDDAGLGNQALSADCDSILDEDDYDCWGGGDDRTWDVAPPDANGVVSLSGSTDGAWWALLDTGALVQWYDDRYTRAGTAGLGCTRVSLDT